MSIFRVALVLLLPATLAHAEDVLIHEAKTADACHGTWVLQGKVTVEDVVRDLSRKYCESFFVAKELLQKKIELVVEPTADRYKMSQRVHAALIANGLQEESELIYAIRAEAPSTPPFEMLMIPTPPSISDSTIDKDTDRGMTCNKDRCEITRAAVDELLSNPQSMAAMAHIIPSFKDGKQRGLKLLAIRPTSFFAKIGLQNGDTVTTMNGFDLSITVDRLLELYAKLRNSEAMTIGVLRNGKPISIRLIIK